MPGESPEASPSHERVALVTGASGAIGRAIARGLAADSRHRVVLLCRDPARASALAEELRRETGNPRVSHTAVDVCRRSSVFALAERWTGPVHILVNAAAVAPRTRQETLEGIELQLATNVLGYLWLVEALQPQLELCAPARVVNVASYWAGGLDLADLEFRRRPYDNDAAYRQSKQANRMLSVALAERLAARGVSVNACHPGDVRSRLSGNLGFGGHESPEQGAQTPVWLATSEVGGQRSGRYFEHLREVPCPFAQDREAVEALYRACLAYG